MYKQFGNDTMMDDYDEPQMEPQLSNPNNQHPPTSSLSLNISLRSNASAAIHDQQSRHKQLNGGTATTSSNGNVLTLQSNTADLLQLQM